ncbi:MAG: large subunit ribosomal protein L13 [Candidatus Berkelbacteria bacterium Licking1014_96]|uniref:Large ribosomal subunit protein uL13 n=1 Tax=Candidatus Berkelbacteria bacterium Licking1014_96 TaxID=2017149 RepID=A0A554LCV3_9BACT|nr:MAG: large subunit ribosomal protein L13 [Candidatus Berkelbacteria bacterium Licking1014_96]
MTRTYTAKKSEIKRNWYLLDAKGLALGRVATRATIILRGKHKKNYTPNIEMGDFVVIINAKFIKYSGKKIEQKEYVRHTGYPGGIRSVSLKELKRVDPTAPIRRAIMGMLPDNRLKPEQIKRIKIYADDKHQHTQRLIKIEI